MSSDEKNVVITSRLSIPLSELSFEFSHATGPGGQNVNKVSTRVTLVFDLAASAALSPEQKARLRQKLASRLTADGRLRLACEQHRQRERNRSETLEKLREVLAAGLARPKPRRPTAPTRSAQERRLQSKKRAGARKQERSRRNRGDDD